MGNAGSKELIKASDKDATDSGATELLDFGTVKPQVAIFVGLGLYVVGSIIKQYNNIYQNETLKYIGELATSIATRTISGIMVFQEGSGPTVGLAIFIAGLFVKHLNEKYQNEILEFIGDLVFNIGKDIMIDSIFIKTIDLIPQINKTLDQCTAQKTAINENRNITRNLICIGQILTMITTFSRKLGGIYEDCNICSKSLNNYLHKNHQEDGRKYDPNCLTCSEQQNDVLFL